LGDRQTGVTGGVLDQHPRCTWRIRLCALYCVQMPTRRMPELTQIDSAKSMMGNLPPKGS